MKTKPSEVRCSKCGGKSQVGFLADSRVSAVAVTYWVSGKPKSARGFALRVSNIMPEQCVPVSTYRCESCGYLESYAQAD